MVSYPVLPALRAGAPVVQIGTGSPWGSARRRRAVATLAALALVGLTASGCAEMAANQAASQATAAGSSQGAAAAAGAMPAYVPPSGPLGDFLVFVGGAEVGASAPVRDGSGAFVYSATVVSAYTAASGHRCKRTVVAGGGREVVRAVCLERGTWRLTPPLIDDDAIGVLDQPSA